MDTPDSPTAAVNALNNLAEEYWETRLKVSPLTAAFLGDHRYDDQADDMSAEAEQERRKLWSDLRGRVSAIPQGELDDMSSATRELLVEELTDAIDGIDLHLTELTSDQMEGAHANVLVMSSQWSAPEPEHARMAVKRVGEIARMLDQAARRYTDGTKNGRVPALINVTRSLSQIENYLDSPIEKDPFANLAGPKDWDAEADREWREQLRRAVEEELRPAFSRHRDTFINVLRPVARPDDQPGLVHLPEGEEIYQSLIKQNTGLDLSPEELHNIGLEESTVKLREEFATVGERAFGTSDLKVIFDRIVNDPDLRYRDRDEILSYAKGYLKKAQAAMGDWFGLLPQAPCKLTPVPDYLEADVPEAYYTPPMPDGGRPGEYHINLYQPTERSRAQSASVAYHEVIPGHHLQLAIASEIQDLPDFRRFGWRHTAFVEGWALYTERLAEEMGLYSDDIERLGMLTADALRAARLVVDTGLHAKGWTRQQAIDFMVENTPMDVESITIEVDRYIGMPAQALAYKVGQREILRLREESKARLGSDFDIKGFHDAVLGGGTISLRVLGQRVAKWSNQPR